MNHAVAVVPGFLGFGHACDRTYFADRFISTLRVNIKARCGGSVRVVPVSTLPVGSLAARQRRLLEEIDQLDKALCWPYWHLVGHSMGGLDAMLLGRSKQLMFDKRHGSRFSNQPLCIDRLRSITTLAAPLYGTTLACTAIAALAQRQVSLDAFKELGMLLFDLTQRDELVSRIQFALGSLGLCSLHSLYSLRSLGSLVSLRSLGPLEPLGPLGSLSLLHILAERDLQPAVAAALTAENNPRGEIPTFCFATVAPTPSPAEPDALFRDLWRLTAEGADTAPLPPPLPDLGRVRIVARDCEKIPVAFNHRANHSIVNRDPPSLPDPGCVPVAPHDCPKLPVVFDHQANDGIVNTDRQCVKDALVAVVLADHADVLGRYRRDDALDGRLVDPGLLTSSAYFSDEEFFTLIELMADRIADVVRSSRPSEAKAGPPSAEGQSTSPSSAHPAAESAPVSGEQEASPGRRRR